MFSKMCIFREEIRYETYLIYTNDWLISTLDKMAAILADDNFKCIFCYENDGIPIPISLWFVTRSPTDNKPALIQVMA